MSRWWLAAVLALLWSVLACGNPFSGAESAPETAPTPRADRGDGERSSARKTTAGRSNTQGKGRAKGKGLLAKRFARGQTRQVGAAEASGIEDAVVAAYLEDCGHVFAAEVEYEFEGDKSNECLAREFDQNCAPDLMGCWGESEGCKDRCGTTCDGCQTDCAATCESCKSRCGRDADCRVRCAQSRAACRTDCMGRKERCEARDCGAAYDRCEEAGRARIDRECPDCSEIASCVYSGTGQSPAACVARFPGNAAACGEWCAAGF